MRARLPLGATTVLAALLGLVHGYLNGSALAQPGLGTAVLIGIVGAVFTLVALAVRRGSAAAGDRPRRRDLQPPVLRRAALELEVGSQVVETLSGGPVR